MSTFIVGISRECHATKLDRVVILSIFLTLFYIILVFMPLSFRSGVRPIKLAKIIIIKKLHIDNAFSVSRYTINEEQ